MCVAMGSNRLLYLFFSVCIGFGHFTECEETCDKEQAKEMEDFPNNLPLKLKDYGVLPIIKAGIKSFSGLLNPTNSNNNSMFYWYFPSECRSSDPLILWLQGDIGTSSLKGIFENNGPFYVKMSKGLKSRSHYWSKHSHVLYLDTTTGVGFSHTGSGIDHPINMNQVVNNLYNTLLTFFELFNLKNKDFYIAGDGFACITITKLAKQIDDMKSSRIRLKGLIIENGLCDPTDYLAVAHHYERLGLINAASHFHFENAEKEIINLVMKKDNIRAFDSYDKYVKGMLTTYKTMFCNYTFYESANNLLYDKDHRQYGDYKSYVMKINIKKLLHISPENAFNDGRAVLKDLRGELMTSVKLELGELTSKYNVLMYFGQSNPEITPRSAYVMASAMKWCGKEYFEDVSYQPWRVEGDLAGYLVDVRVAMCQGSLTYALVRNAGKSIAGDEPKKVADLIQKFLSSNLPRKIY